MEVLHFLMRYLVLTLCAFDLFMVTTPLSFPIRKVPPNTAFL